MQRRAGSTRRIDGTGGGGLPRERLIAFVLVVAVLSACSRVELAYENADWLGAWRIANGLELNRTQRLWLRDEIAAYRVFHRAHRLPELLAAMDAAEALLSAPDAGDAGVVGLLAAAEHSLRATATDLIPLTAELLRRLDTAQLAALEARLADGRERYLRERLLDQEARAVERTRDWVGELSAAQQAGLGGCVGALPDVSDDWQDWRIGVEQALLALLRTQPVQAEVEHFLHAWWLHEEARPAALQRYRAVSRSLWQHCSQALLLTLTPAQRSYALARLGRYRSALGTLYARAPTP
jgi:hypothetical protein